MVTNAGVSELVSWKICSNVIGERKLWRCGEHGDVRAGGKMHSWHVAGRVSGVEAIYKHIS